MEIQELDSIIDDIEEALVSLCNCTPEEANACVRNQRELITETLECTCKKLLRTILLTEKRDKWFG